jgi:hypothetical protein
MFPDDNNAQEAGGRGRLRERVSDSLLPLTVAPLGVRQERTYRPVHASTFSSTAGFRTTLWFASRRKKEPPAFDFSL